jgi:hypothetical protein
MALSQTTLKDSLVSMLYPGQADPTGALASAFGAYMTQATGILPAGIAAAVTAMKNAMSFSDDMTAAQGASQFGSGVGAFWAAMVAAPATYFTGATVITPPSTAAMVSALEADFPVNTSGDATLAEAMDAIATSMHAGTVGLGSYTVPPAGPTAIV